MITLYKFAMNIRGRQSEIGVQRSRHRVTNYNERARIDVEESRENEDGDGTKWDEIEKKPRREESKRSREEDEETLSGRSRVSNSAMAITSLLLLRVVFRRLSTITGWASRAKQNARTKGIVGVFVYRARYGRVLRSLEKSLLQIWGRLELLSYRRRRDMISELRHVIATHFSISS